MAEFAHHFYWLRIVSVAAAGLVSKQSIGLIRVYVSLVLFSPMELLVTVMNEVECAPP